MLRLKILFGRQAGQIVLARRFPFRIGRNPQADLVLADAGVWDEHCQLTYRPRDGVYVTPVANAETRIDSEAVQHETRLPNGSELSLGAVRIHCALADPAPRRLGLREAIAWFFLLAVGAIEGWLIWALPR